MSDSENIQALVTKLRSNDISELSEAARAILQCGTAARVAAADLVQAVGDDEELVREAAASALEDLGPPPSEILPKLVPLLASRQPDVAYWAATLIGRAGTEAGDCCEALIAAMDSTRPTAVRQRAAWALGKLGRAAAQARTALLETCQDPDARLATLSGRALEEILK